MMRRRRDDSSSSLGHDDSISTLPDYGENQRPSSMSISSGAAPSYGYGNENGGGAGGGYSSHVGSGHNIRRSNSAKRLSGSGSGFSGVLPVLGGILSTLFFCTTLHYRSKYNASLLTHGSFSSGLNAKVTALQREKDHLESEIRTMKKRTSRLDEKVADLTTMNHNLKRNQEEQKSAHWDHKEEVEDKFEVYKDRMEWLEEQVAKESHRSVLERFGPGPHQVSVQVKLPADPTNYPNIPEDPSFVINLADIKKMPHTVWYFLEQVSHGLWDGCSFVIGAPHIFQAGAHPGPGSHPEDKMEAFEELELDGISFQEYHDDYPHVKYSVGIAGRPHGGPDWYINAIDNTKTHGPGGQPDLLLPEEADPCFGMIEDGFSRGVVDRLFVLPSDEDEYHELIEPLHIVKATIVGWTDPAQQRGEGEANDERPAEPAPKEEVGDPGNQ